MEKTLISVEENGKSQEDYAGAKPPIPIESRGFALRTLDDAWRFAQYVSKAGLAPKGLERPEAVVVALQFGMELGLHPMQSLQSIAVINGRPTIWGDTMLGLCMSSGLFDFSAFKESAERKGEDFVATCQVKRKGMAEPVIRTFSLSDAKRAGLLEKPGPWKQFPERMCRMRARAFALRDAFPDVLRGVYAAEELVDVEPVESQKKAIDVVAETISKHKQGEASN